MRPALRYDEERAGAAGQPMFDSEIPTAGFYRVRLAPGAPDSAIRIWRGHSLDPVTGEEMLERSPQWQCELQGQRIDFHRFWPSCARNPISREDFERITARNATMDEASPFYDPRQPIDLGRAPPPF